MLLISLLVSSVICEGQNTSVKIKSSSNPTAFLALDDNEIAIADENNPKTTFIVSLNKNSPENKPVYRIKSLISTGYMLGRDDAGQLVSTNNSDAASVDWEIILDPTKTFEVIRNGETCLTFHSDSFHLEQCGDNPANPPPDQKFAVLTGEQKLENSVNPMGISTLSNEDKDDEATPPPSTHVVNDAEAPKTETKDQGNTASLTESKVTDSFSDIKDGSKSDISKTLSDLGGNVQYTSNTDDQKTNQNTEFKTESSSKKDIPKLSKTLSSADGGNSTIGSLSGSQTSSDSVTVNTISHPGGQTQQMVTNEVEEVKNYETLTSVSSTETQTLTSKVIVTTLSKLIETTTQKTTTLTDTIAVTETCTSTEFKTQLVKIPYAEIPSGRSNRPINGKLTCEDKTKLFRGPRGLNDIDECEDDDECSESCDASLPKNKRRRSRKDKKRNMFTEAISNISKFVNGPDVKNKSSNEDSEVSDSSSMLDSECDGIDVQDSQISDFDALSDVVCELNKLGDFDKNGVMASGIEVPDIFRPRQILADKKKVIRKTKPQADSKKVKTVNQQSQSPKQSNTQQTPLQRTWQPYLQPPMQPQMMIQQPVYQQQMQLQPPNQVNAVRTMICNPVTPAC